MPDIKTILFKLSKSYADKVDQAKATAERIIRQAEAAKKAGQEIQSAKVSQPPKK